MFRRFLEFLDFPDAKTTSFLRQATAERHSVNSIRQLAAYLYCKIELTWIVQIKDFYCPPRKCLPRSKESSTLLRMIGRSKTNSSYPINFN